VLGVDILSGNVPILDPYASLCMEARSLLLYHGRGVGYWLYIIGSKSWNRLRVIGAD